MSTIKGFFVCMVAALTLLSCVGDANAYFDLQVPVAPNGSGVLLNNLGPSGPYSNTATYNNATPVVVSVSAGQELSPTLHHLGITINNSTSSAVTYKFVLTGDYNALIPASLFDSNLSISVIGVPDPSNPSHDLTGTAIVSKTTSLYSGLLGTGPSGSALLTYNVGPKSVSNTDTVPGIGADNSGLLPVTLPSSYEIVTTVTVTIDANTSLNITQSDDTVTSTPAPATMLLGAFGLPAFGLMGWMRRRNAAATVVA